MVSFLWRTAHDLFFKAVDSMSTAYEVWFTSLRCRSLTDMRLHWTPSSAHTPLTALYTHACQAARISQFLAFLCSRRCRCFGGSSVMSHSPRALEKVWERENDTEQKICMRRRALSMRSASRASVQYGDDFKYREEEWDHLVHHYSVSDEQLNNALIIALQREGMCVCLFPQHCDRWLSAFWTEEGSSAGITHVNLLFGWWIITRPPMHFFLMPAYFFNCFQWGQRNTAAAWRDAGRLFHTECLEFNFG